MTQLSPSQIALFEKLAEELEGATPTERERRLAKVADSTVVRLLRLSGLWAPEITVDIGQLKGRVVDGKYMLLNVIGEGGFGVVYKAEQDFGDGKRRPVAIKFLRPELCHGAALDLFRREVAHLIDVAGSRAAGLVAVVDRGELGLGHAGGPPRVPYIVTEFIAGQPLDRWLPLAMNWKAKVNCFVGVCDAVQALHASDADGRAHSDLKPANILVTDRGQPVILDYGLAQVMSPFVVTGSLGGTLYYAAPEQLDVPSRLDLRSDVYALGVILYQRLVGQLPYSEGDTKKLGMRECIRTGATVPLRKVQADLPAGLEKVLAKALSREPQLRYATAAEFGEALKSLVQARPAKSGSGGASVIQKVTNRGGTVAVVGKAREINIS